MLKIPSARLFFGRVFFCKYGNITASTAVVRTLHIRSSYGVQCQRGAAVLIVIGIFARCVRTVNVISRLNYYTHYSCLTIPNTVSVVLDILQLRYWAVIRSYLWC